MRFRHGCVSQCLSLAVLCSCDFFSPAPLAPLFFFVCFVCLSVSPLCPHGTGPPSANRSDLQFAASLPPSDREGQTDWDRQVESEELWMRAQPATSEFALNGKQAGACACASARIGAATSLSRIPCVSKKHGNMAPSCSSCLAISPPPQQWVAYNRGRKKKGQIRPDPSHFCRLYLRKA